MKTKPIFLFLLLCFAPCASYAQDFTTTHLTTADGLPSNKVYYAFKDSKGFMWFCTEAGVSRFNGNSVETFTIKDGLADNDILFCFEDQWNRIWFSSINGQLSFFEKEKFYNAKNCSFLPKIDRRKQHIAAFIQNNNDSSFHVLHHMSDSMYLIITKNKVFYEQPANVNNLGELEFYRDHLSLYFTKPLDSKKHFMFSLTKKNSGQSKAILVGDKMKDPFIIVPNKTHSLHWYRTNNRVYQLDSNFTSLKLKGEGFVNLITNKMDTFFAYEHGLKITSGQKSKWYLKDRQLTSLAFDNYDNLYATTYTEGVYIFSYAVNKVKSLPLEVNSLYRQNGNTILLSKDNKLYKKQNDQIEFIKQLKLSEKLNLAGIYNQKAILVFQSHKIARSSLLKKNDLAMDRLKNETHLKQKYIQGDILYLQYRDGIITYDLRRQKETLYDNTKNGRAHGFFCSGQEGWLFGDGGLYKIQDSLRQLPQYKNRNIYRAALLGNDLFFIDMKDYNLYLHKNFILKPQNNATLFYTLTTTQDLKKISPTAIIIRDNYVTNRVISKRKGKYLLEGLQNGLQNIELTYLQSDSIKLYVDRKNNTAIYSIDAIKLPTWCPTIAAKIISFGKDSAMVNPSEVYIRHADKLKVNIKYSVLGNLNMNLFYQFAILAKNQKDTLWNELKRPEIQLINPNWGSYTILFKATNSENIDSPIEAVTLKIQAPLYLRTWFILCAILTLTALTYYITSRTRLKKQRQLLKEKEIEKKNLSNEFKALNALMNPHFIFNALNTIQNLITKDKEKANEYLITFSDLVRQNMQNIKQELIGLDKEIELVRNYLELEKLRFKDKLNFTINIDDAHFLNETKLPPLSIQPIVENCIKHGIMPLKEKNGKIIIAVTEHTDHVAVSVMDNGIGFHHSKNKEGSQSALKNIQKRFEVLSKIHNTNYSFDVLNQEAENEFKYIVVLKIPYE